MPAYAAIVAIGDELISGKTQDSNSSYIASELERWGVQVQRVFVVGDESAVIIDSLRTACENYPLVLTSGGLGPTEDDLTRHAVAELVGKPLVLDSSSLERLKAHAERRGRELNDNNKRQAYYPEGSIVLENPAGTADIFITKVGEGSDIISLPGVPREVKAIVPSAVKAWVEENLPAREGRSERVLRVFGLPESRIGELIEAAALSPNVRVAYRPHFPIVSLFLSVSGVGEQSEALLRSARAAVSKALGEEHIFADAIDVSFAQSVGELLRAKGLSFSCAESCTGGLVAERMISVPGASDYFFASFVTYRNQDKHQLLGVSAEALEKYGAVSESVAIEMARGARAKTGSDIAVSTTGIAGPSGGSEEKPIGTLWVGFSSASTEFARPFHVSFTRNDFRVLAAHLALDVARRELLG